MDRAGLQADFFENYRGYSPKKPTHKMRLLTLFLDWSWHSNIELNQICFNYKGRIMGYLFERKHIQGSEWSWKLVGRV